MPLGNGKPNHWNANGPSAPPATLANQNAGPPQGQVFAPLEHTQIANTGVEDGSGSIIVAFPVPADRLWLVERITVSTTSSTTTTASVYTGEANPQNLVDQTPNGNSDVSDEINPIIVSSGSVLTIKFTGASSGSVGTVRIQFKSGTYQSGPIFG